MFLISCSGRRVTLGHLHTSVRSEVNILTPENLEKVPRPDVQKLSDSLRKSFDRELKPALERLRQWRARSRNSNIYVGPCDGIVD